MRDDSAVRWYFVARVDRLRSTNVTVRIPMRGGGEAAELTLAPAPGTFAAVASVTPSTTARATRDVARTSGGLGLLGGGAQLVGEVCGHRVVVGVLDREATASTRA